MSGHAISSKKLKKSPRNSLSQTFKKSNGQIWSGRMLTDGVESESTG